MSSNKAQHLQGQVDDVVGIMHQNVTEVMKRGENLNIMKNKAEDLEQGAKAFSGNATRVKRKAWWQDLKLKILIALIILVILVIVIVPMFVKK